MHTYLSMHVRTLTILSVGNPVFYRYQCTYCMCVYACTHTYVHKYIICLYVLYVDSVSVVLARRTPKGMSQILTEVTIISYNICDAVKI